MCAVSVYIFYPNTGYYKILNDIVEERNKAEQGLREIIERQNRKREEIVESHGPQISEETRHIEV